MRKWEKICKKNLIFFSSELCGMLKVGNMHKRFRITQLWILVFYPICLIITSIATEKKSKIRKLGVPIPVANDSADCIDQER